MNANATDQRRSERGIVTTFYSFKGGTGRSMAAANTACLLARSGKGKRVLLIDWDLEAPGLHRYFQADCYSKPGLVEYFATLEEKLRTDATLYEALKGPDGFRHLEDALPFEDFVHPLSDVGIDLLAAGRLDSAYVGRMRAFRWAEFRKEFPVVFDAFRDLITENYSDAIIDSRTGHTDVGGICTMVLPQRLVAVFAPNHQNLDLRRKLSGQLSPTQRKYGTACLINT